jgi:hypothetical protein
MKALTWHGKRDVRVEVMSPYLDKGDVLGRESMGIVGRSAHR